MDGTTPDNIQQPEPQAPIDRSAIEAEILGKIFGDKNFRSVDEAAKSYWNLNNYASQAHQLLQERANPALQAQQRQADPFEQLENEALVKKDLLRQAIRTEAGVMLNDALAPLASAWQARQELSVTLPEYVKNESEIVSWLASNPQVHQKVERLNRAGMYDLAAETALTSWRAANPPANQGNAQQKQQAALPNTSQFQRPPLDPQQSQDMMAQAIRYKQMTGDARPAYSMVFPDFKVQLPPHLADQFQQR